VQLDWSSLENLLSLFDFDGNAETETAPFEFSWVWSESLAMHVFANSAVSSTKIDH